MRTPIIAALAASILVAGPALAGGFEVISSARSITGPIGAVEVTVSPDIVEEQERTIARHGAALDSIGPSDVDEVVEVVSGEIAKRLHRANAYLEGASGAATLQVTVTKAHASDLQFTEYGRVNSLQGGSTGAGGGEFTARLVGADGTTLAEYAYSRYEANIGDNSPIISTWYDLQRAAYWFADNIAGEVSRSS